MQLELLKIELRPRTSWQAIDLGFPLLWSHAREVFGPWLVVWSLACLPGLVVAMVWPELGLLAPCFPWFFRPLLERLPLHVLSRAVFGQSLPMGRAVREWLGLCRSRWFLPLTLGRLIPTRGLYQPIHQLEGLEGREIAERRGQLGSEGAGRTAGLWLVICCHFEMLLLLLPSFLAGLFFTETEIVNPFAFLTAGGADFTRLDALVWGAGYWLAGSLVGPVFVATSFTLYLNRRASLEAWDLELSLRRMVRRHAGEAIP